jgi:hypothetical protein
MHVALQKNKPVFIETPAGLIRIEMELTSYNKRRAIVEVPPGLRVAKGEQRAKEDAKFLEFNNGHVRPKYRFLVPVTDADGNLIGVDSPEVLAIRQA